MIFCGIPLEACGLDFPVDLMGHWSNLSHQGERLRTLVEMVPSGAIEPKSRTTKQIHRRLRQAETEALISDYHSGLKMKELAAKYRINKYTVTKVIQRAGIRPRYPALLPEDIKQAAKLYKSGQSLAVVAKHFGVDPSTIRLALLRTGVAMRDSHGNER